MKTNEKIRMLRKQNGITQEELAEYLNTTKQTIYKYEMGIITNIPLDKIEKLAKKFNVSAAYLAGWDDTEIVPVELWQFDVVGKIAAGYDREPIMSYTGEKTTIPAIPGYDKEDLIVCSIFGTSMYPQFLEGDKVVVRLTPSVNSGDVALIMVGDEATIKKVVYQKDGETEQFMELIPTNPEYPSKKITGELLNSCRVIGKVIKLLRDV